MLELFGQDALGPNTGPRFRQWLRSRGWMPDQFHERTALIEALDGPWSRDLPELLSLASFAHARYRSLVRGSAPIDPHFLAHVLNVSVVLSAADDVSHYHPEHRIITYPSRADVRREQFDIFHELAHAMLGGDDHHADVQILGICLGVDRAMVQALTGRHGFSEGLRALVRQHSELQPWQVVTATFFYTVQARWISDKQAES